ncbi:P13 family porin (plasmid) [Borreliella finlandensis]|uniref:Outer membrane protein P13 n=1 Tax=Borreliella finlandensis TaxID=498741 RepID=A0A806CB00_9SPIR|nr:P13 family porin [Borreliella finlandensis]ACN93386.1 outer membrane protein P13 [Borreliella finlandensis]ACN93524.1 outer membrane protein P13 [Borreliella finlandensis]
MKKILTLILILGLTIQIFATQDKLEKSVGSIEAIMKYKSEKATILAPFLLNLFLTLGIGSFVQGDYIGGGAVLGSQLLGGILCIAGNILGHTDDEARATTGHIITTIGVGTIIASHIASLIIPFTFANKHNANLKKRLGIDIAGFEPNFDIGINGFQLSFKKRY